MLLCMSLTHVPSEQRRLLRFGCSTTRAALTLGGPGPLPLCLVILVYVATLAHDLLTYVSTFLGGYSGQF